MTITSMSCFSFGMMFMALLTIIQTKEDETLKVPRLLGFLCRFTIILFVLFSPKYKFANLGLAESLSFVKCN